MVDVTSFLCVMDLDMAGIVWVQELTVFGI